MKKEYTDDHMMYGYCDCSREKAECFEFGMKWGDVQMCSHMGSCDNDCEEMRDVDYIREQFDKLSNIQLFGFVNEYICDEDISDKINNRQWLELYTIWLVAGNIHDDVYCGDYMD